MNYENIIYLADQILGHIKEGWDQQRKTWQISAIYPSKAGKPFNVRIYHTPDPSFFYVNWKINEKPGHLTIHLKRLKEEDYRWKCRKKTRSKAGKRIRAEESALRFKNIIILPENPSEDELCLQAGCYLIRDGFLDNAEKWKIYKLFDKYVSKHLLPLWLKISKAPEGHKAFENLCKYFKIPADEKDFYKYLKTTFTGIAKTLYKKSPDYFNYNAKKELGSTFYAWIYSGKIKPQKVKGKYVLTPEISIQLEKYLDDKKQHGDERKGLIEFAKEKGMNPESLLRNARRWRRKGILQEKVKSLLNKQ